MENFGLQNELKSKMKITSKLTRWILSSHSLIWTEQGLFKKKSLG